MWTLKSSNGRPIFAQRVLVDGPVPVFLVGSGSYPKFINEHGELHSDLPHVEVSLASALSNGALFVTNYYITAVNGWRNGRQRAIRIASHVSCGRLTTEAEIQALLDSLSGEISAAVEQCHCMDATHEAAQQRLAILGDLTPQCATREGYERACEAAGVDALPDDEIRGSYGVTYGNFSFPEYQPDFIIKMALAAARQHAINEAAAVAPQQAIHCHAANSHAPAKAGQLWEQCRCGQEPVYLPLHLCEKCWPKGF